MNTNFSTLMPEPIICPLRSEWPALLVRPLQDRSTLELEVHAVFAAMAAEGMEALNRFALQWDGTLPDPLEVPAERIQQAALQLDAKLRQAIDQAADQIERYHAAQLSIPSKMETAPGVFCWRESRPIDCVGLYAPGGSTPLISSVLMTGIPARLAGCPEIVLCTPPSPDGWPVPAVLYAASKAGVKRVFRIGGAQAIAAMTLGVGMPRVNKLFGPGSARVEVAKSMAARYGVALYLPAGPSEVLVLSDGSMNPEWAAADLLAQAEHGPDSQVIAVSWSGELIQAVSFALSRQLVGLPREAIARRSLQAARLIQTADEAEAFELVNEYAPEHLILGMEDATGKLPGIRNAGAVFLGSMSPESAGDYATGSNHCLPTGGAAKAWSGLSVADFQRQMSVQQLSKEGLIHLAQTITCMAREEQLEAHARAVEVRLPSMFSPQ